MEARFFPTKNVFVGKQMTDKNLTGYFEIPLGSREL